MKGKIVTKKKNVINVSPAVVGEVNKPLGIMEIHEYIENLWIHRVP